MIPDEVIQYAGGHYGEPVAPIDEDVLDRIMAAPRAREVLAEPPEQPRSPSCASATAPTMTTS